MRLNTRVLLAVAVAVPLLVIAYVGVAASSADGRAQLGAFMMGARIARIEGRSMEPSCPADTIIAYRGRAAYGRGEIVAFTMPDQPNQISIKRVIALPGERVEVTRNGVRVDGQPLDERWPHTPGNYTTPAVLVPRGHYYVLGDQRDSSNDSHLYGPIDGPGILGTGECEAG